MDGIFLRKQFNIWLVLLFLCGAAFIGMYIFFSITDPEATTGLISFLIIGILIWLAVIPSWFLNKDAFIRIEEDSLKAKYHWFGKIDCKLSDVAFSSAGFNTVTILLHSGRCHTIMGVENSWALASAIRRAIPFQATQRPEVLTEKLNALKAAKRKSLIFVLAGLVLMFLNIFIAVFLTGGKEMYDFCLQDWVLFGIMGVIELATVIATFYFAQKTGKHNTPIEKQKYELQRTVLETKPLLPGHILKVFADEDFTGRITVYGYPNEDAVYYVIQRLLPDYTLVKTYESEQFENYEQLSAGFEAFIDITKATLHRKSRICS